MILKAEELQNENGTQWTRAQRSEKNKERGSPRRRRQNEKASARLYALHIKY
jgi:hypothetical protein